MFSIVVSAPVFQPSVASPTSSSGTLSGDITLHTCLLLFIFLFLRLCFPVFLCLRYGTKSQLKSPYTLISLTRIIDIINFVALLSSIYVERCGSWQGVSYVTGEYTPNNDIVTRFYDTASAILALLKKILTKIMVSTIVSDIMNVIIICCPCTLHGRWCVMKDLTLGPHSCPPTNR